MFHITHCLYWDLNYYHHHQQSTRLRTSSLSTPLEHPNDVGLAEDAVLLLVDGHLRSLILRKQHLIAHLHLHPDHLVLPLLPTAVPWSNGDLTSVE